jgi:hypothetical protein
MDAADGHVCFRGARRIPRKFFWTPNNYSQSFESAPKNATPRLRGGYATRKYRPETNWLRIGTALAPEHSKRLGVTNQSPARQTLDDAHTMRTTKKERHNQREKKVAQNKANRRRKRKKQRQLQEPRGQKKKKHGRDVRARKTEETTDSHQTLHSRG